MSIGNRSHLVAPAVAVRTPAIVSGLRAADIVERATSVRAARFVGPGVVRVKKNSLRRIKRGERVLSVSSAAHERWENDAVLRLQSQAHRQPKVSGWGLLNLRALIYLDKEPGLTNLDNLIGSVMDALQDAKIVGDDCLIRGLDGCRIRVDRQNPRCEITLSPLTDADG